MGFLWRKGSTKYQKIVAGALSASLIGPLFMIFTHNFVAKTFVSSSAIYISLALTLLSFTLVWYLRSKKLWEPAPVWYSYSKLTRTLIIPFAPIFIFGLFWVNFAISAPHLYTVIFGTEGIRNDVIRKDKHHSRRSCDYRLEPKSIDAIFFHFCISEEFYNRLPDGDLYGELVVKESSLGYAVEDIRITLDKH
jgi:hypothetical protein